MKIGEFFKLTKVKVIFDLVLSLILVMVFLLCVPVLRATFLSRTFSRQIFDVILNTVIFGIVLYPLSCLFIFILRKIFKKNKNNKRRK